MKYVCCGRRHFLDFSFILCSSLKNPSHSSCVKKSSSEKSSLTWSFCCKKRLSDVDKQRGKNLQRCPKGFAGKQRSMTIFFLLLTFDMGETVNRRHMTTQKDGFILTGDSSSTKSNISNRNVLKIVSDPHNCLFLSLGCTANHKILVPICFGFFKTTKQWKLPRYRESFELCLLLSFSRIRSAWFWPKLQQF